MSTRADLILQQEIRPKTGGRSIYGPSPCHRGSLLALSPGGRGQNVRDNCAHMPTRPNLFSEPSTSEGRSLGLMRLPVFLLTILAALIIFTAGIFIREKLVAQDSVQELETQVKQANDQDQLTFFDTLSDRKVNIGPNHRIHSPTVIAHDQPPPSVTAHNQQQQPSPLRDRSKPKVDNQQTTDTAVKHPSSGESSGKGYTIQVSAHRMQEEAEKIIQTLRTRGYSAYLAKENLGGQMLWYRVRIGRFSGRPEAERHLHELSEKAGLQGFVIPSAINSQGL